VRVVSLVPSLTESLLAWGITPIACTRFCEQPDLPHVGGTKNPDIAAIVALAPDIVLMDREENRREDADALSGAGLRVHATDVTTFAQALALRSELAPLLGLAPSPPVSVPADTEILATAAMVVWRRPWMTCNGGTYASSLLRSIGVANVFAGETATYPQVELADVAARRPGVVLLPSEPYAFREQHVDEVAAAVPGARVVRVDGQDLFWWGARSLDARDRLAQGLVGAP
jgi:ABC-type Fe3+-hydroxamate transport system substrate-binding protein